MHEAYRGLSAVVLDSYPLWCEAVEMSSTGSTSRLLGRRLRQLLHWASSSGIGLNPW